MKTQPYLHLRLNLALLYDHYNSFERPRVVHAWFKRTLGSGKPSRNLSLLFWETVAREWCGFDAIPHDDFVSMFGLFRQHWTAECMTKPDRLWYNDLPDEFTAYRGQSKAAIPGLSWTIDRHVAVSFADGHRGHIRNDPLIITATLRKNQIAFVQTERKEGELVLFNPPLR